MDGETNVIKNAKIVRQLNKGDSFGEQALYTTNSVRGMTVQAKSEVHKKIEILKKYILKTEPIMKHERKSNFSFF